MLRTFIAFLGRVCLSLVFFAAAMHQILDWPGSEQHLIQGLTEGVKTYMGYPWIQQGLEWALADTHFLLLVATSIEIVCGLMIFLGLWVRLGALLLILVMLPSTLLFHHFWDVIGMDREVQMALFLKNLGIIGGLLILLAYGKGRQRVFVNDKTSEAP